MNPPPPGFELQGAPPPPPGFQLAAPPTQTTPIRFGKEGFKETLLEDYRKAPWLDRQLIGAGTAMSNVYEGVKQWAGGGDTSKIEANRVISEENPGAAFAGNVGMFAPTAMIPGANTLTGSAVVGGAMGAMQPTLEGESRALNTAVGAGAGAVGKVVGDKVASAVTSKEASEAARQSRNSIKDATLQNSRDAGYVVPKSEVAPSFLNNRLESLAGKAALKQDATLKNQEVSNALGRKVIDLADDQPLSTSAIDSFRHQAAEPYRQIAAIDPRAASALEMLKDTRAEARAQWNHYNRQAVPEAMRMAKALDQKAQAIESAIDKMATKSGKPDLVVALREARKRIAQSHDLERSLNTSTGDVDARVLGRLLDKGKPLSDELGTVANFNNAFPKFAGPGPNTPAPGVSKAEALAAALLAMGGGATAGPMGMAAGALPLLSGPARSLLLSKPYQNMATPNYGVSNTALLARKLAPQVPVAGAGGALEALR